MSDTVELSSLSDQDKNAYVKEKLSKFYLTITVCVIYGVIAIVLLLLAVFTSWGNQVLQNDMLAFVITFIIGTTIIVIWLANEIYNFKPKKPSDKLSYDSEMCPDYWKLEYVDTPNKVDQNNQSFLTANLNSNHFKYKCVMNPTLFQPRRFVDADNKKAETEKLNYKINPNNKLYVAITDKSKTGITADESYEKFKEYAANMNGYTYTKSELTRNSADSLSGNNENFNKDKIPLACDSVYPLYLAVMDDTNSKKNPSEPSNRFRCAYAKSCGIPWTEAGCV